MESEEFEKVQAVVARSQATIDDLRTELQRAQEKGSALEYVRDQWLLCAWLSVGVGDALFRKVQCAMRIKWTLPLLEKSDPHVDSDVANVSMSVMVYARCAFSLLVLLHG